LSVTTYLGITHIEESQSQKEVTANAAINILDEAAGVGGFVITIDGGGSEIADATQVLVPIPYDIEVTSVTALADVSGSIVVDVWNDTYANYPATDADTVTASAPITISTATKSTDSTLTGWDKTWAGGSHVIFNVDSCTTIERCTIIVNFKKVI
jgi:hypothetical protein